MLSIFFWVREAQSLISLKKLSPPLERASLTLWVKRMGVIAWIKRLLSKEDEEEPLLQRIEREEFERKHVYPFVRKPGSQATRQNIGRFMKHGRQLKQYRASVKAKVQPEEMKK